MWTIVDKNNYLISPLCTIWFGTGTQDNAGVSSTTLVPTTTKLTFSPFCKYGSCETTQEGGYINSARFTTQLDVTKPLFLQVVRYGRTEESVFYLLFLGGNYQQLIRVHTFWKQCLCSTNYNNKK